MVSCSGTEGENSLRTDIEEILPVVKSSGSLNIMVDPRIELLTAVQLSSNYSLLTHLSFDYLNQKKAYFQDYNQHQAIITFQSIHDLGFNFATPPSSMLYLKYPMELQVERSFNQNIILRSGSEQNLLDFVEEIRSFAIESNFYEFYTGNLEFYQDLVNYVYEDIKQYNLTQALDNFFGMEANSFNLILSPIMLSGGYAHWIESDNGLNDIFGIIGPSEINGNVEGYNRFPQYSKDIAINLIWHEFSHAFVNPTTEMYLEEIFKYEELQDKIAEDMARQGYSDWESSVKEHIVNAVTTSLTYFHFGEEAGNRVLENYIERGFIYIEPLLESLIIYKDNRDIYPDFTSYFPELIKVFANIYEHGDEH